MAVFGILEVFVIGLADGLHCHLCYCIVSGLVEAKILELLVMVLDQSCNDGPGGVDWDN